MPEEIAAFKKAGMSGHVAKPVDRKQLFKQIAQAMDLEQRGPDVEHPDAQPEDLINETLVLEDFKGDVQTWRYLVFKYLNKEFISDWQQLASQVQERDFSQAKTQAHRMKGAFFLLRLPLASTYFSRLENAAINRNPDLLDQYIRIVPQIIAQTREMVDRYAQGEDREQ
jgi:HPt (histidine-containing phosphotransfer) domain-containing protein